MAVADATAETTETTAQSNGKVPDVVTWPFRFEIVPLDELHVDSTYQRPLTSFWKEVKESFNPALIGTLIVSERKAGKKSIIDGQTRWEAMKARGGVPGAPCVIFEGLSRAQEADLFADLQTKRRGMRTYHRFRAQLVAKKPKALGIAAAVTEAGFELGIEETPNTMQSISALEKVYTIGADHLADVLGVIRDVWGTESKDAQHGWIISGLSYFLRTQKSVDYDRLISRLGDVTPKLLLNRASQIREGTFGTGSAKSVSQAILGEYMRKR